MVALAPHVEAARATPAVSQRAAFVDVFRGLLITHMALDHASLMFNAGRGHEELAVAQPAPPADIFQFLTRFTGIQVAPSFFFMAGFMVALTSSAREKRGMDEAAITRRLVVRGLVLLGVDAIVLGLPRGGYYSFVVLSSIGAALIALAFLRRLPSKVLLPAALAILVLHPLLDVSSLPLALRAVLYEPVRQGSFRSLYPVIPWIAIVLVGYVVGRDALVRNRPARFWALLAVACLACFFAVRLPGGYGNAYPHSGIGHLDFWFFAKYPPDLPFLSWGFAATFAMLALTFHVTRVETPRVLRPFVIFGRVPFFFYVVHFYVLGLTRGQVSGKVGLLGTYLIWLALLVVMAGPCIWYYRKKRDRPNFITRYF